MPRLTRRAFLALGAAGSAWLASAGIAAGRKHPHPSPTPTPTVTPVPTQSVTITPIPSLVTVQVNSIATLKTALANNANDVIVVANGTYSVAAAQSVAATSLWIDGTYARTRPVLVRAQTRGGVTFDRGGGSAQAIRFISGAQNQTWDGFVFANTAVSSSGVVFFGGTLGEAAPHHITMQYCTVDGTNTRDPSSVSSTDHAVYLSYSLDGPHDITFDNLTVIATNATTGLQSGMHADHGYPADSPNLSAHDIRITNFTFNGNATITTQSAIIMWQPPLSNWTIDTATITNAGAFAVRYEPIAASGNVISRVTSTGSGSAGFFSSLGAFGSIAGLTGSGNSFA